MPSDAAVVVEVVMVVVAVFATRAFTFCTVGVARADTLYGGRFAGSRDCRDRIVVLEVSRGVCETLGLVYAGIEVLNVRPRSRPLKVGVFGTDWVVGRGGGGDFNRGLGFGLLLGLLVFFGEDFMVLTLDGTLISLSSLGIGGTGGMPCRPGSTMRDFRLDAFVASRKTVFGEG